MPTHLRPDLTLRSLLPHKRGPGAPPWTPNQKPDQKPNSMGQPVAELPVAMSSAPNSITATPSAFTIGWLYPAKKSAPSPAIRR